MTRSIKIHSYKTNALSLGGKKRESHKSFLSFILERGRKKHVIMTSFLMTSWAGKIKSNTVHITKWAKNSINVNHNNTTPFFVTLIIDIINQDSTFNQNCFSNFRESILI